MIEHCSLCGWPLTVRPEWTEENARREMALSGMRIEDCDVVCGDCYKQVMMLMARHATKH